MMDVVCIRSLSLAIVAVAAVPARSVADDVALTEAVTVASDTECITALAVIEHLSTWLGRDVLDARLRVVLEADAEHASFEILRDGARVGARRFDRLPSACADRRAAITLAIALALDDTVLEGALGEDTPTEDPRTGDAPAGETPATVTAETSPPAPDEGEPASDAGEAPLGLGLELGAGVLLGSLPEPAFLGTFDLRIVLPLGISVRLGALATSMTSAPLSSGRVELWLLGARAALCLGREVASPLALEGCVGVWAGSATGTGIGFARSERAEVPFVMPSARLEARVTPVAWLSIFLAAEGTLTAARPRFALEGSGIFRDLGDVGLFLGGGAAILLWS